jgi:hypothetical protein
MKRNDEIERRVLGVCWLDEDEMRDLLVKDLVWKEGWLYAVHRWSDWSDAPFLDLLNRDHHRAYEKYIWIVGESWVPVIVGHEQVLLQLIEGRDPEEHVFPEVHMPPPRVRTRLKHQYASRLYTMFSGLTPPIDNRRITDYEDYSDVHYRYDVEAVYDVTHVLGEPLYMADYIAMRSIGRRSPRRRKGKDPSAVKKCLRTEQT